MGNEFFHLLAGSHATKEIEPSIYEHTFTPSYWGSETDVATPGRTLTLDTLSRVLDDIRANAREYSFSWLISADIMQQIRHLNHLAQMYRAHPIPRRKIRKCHMRKIHAAWRKGRAHIRRVELAERVREEAAMQQTRANA